MNKTPRTYYLAAFGIALAIWPAVAFFSGHPGRSSKTIRLSDERELKVNLDAGYADVTIARGAADEAVNASATGSSITDLENCIDYSVRDRIGYLDISTGCNGRDDGGRHRKRNIHLSDLKSEDWDLKFSDALPVHFDIQLGFGHADIDLSGFAIKDLTMSTGASSVNLRFDEPNKYTIDDVSIEAGLSKFTARGLCNANFRHLKFEGGVGEYRLDFGGKLNRDAEVDIEVGLGSLTVTVPEAIGAKIYYEKSWIAHLDLASSISEREDNTYYTDNYGHAGGNLNIRIEAGMGSVKIRR